MAAYQLPPVDNPKQFEQFMADLLNEHYHTVSFKCFGKNGHNQKGIDVFSAQKQLVVQCKHKDLRRSPLLQKKDLLDDIDKTLSTLKRNPTTIFFGTLIIATTVSEHPDYDEYVSELKTAYDLPFDILFWGWETIQQRLSHLPNTLAKYYPHFRIKDLEIKSSLLSKLAMKKRIEKDFGEWLNYAPENRRFRSRMIIHSATDTHYPEHPNKHGPWYWFGAEIARVSTKGLGFINEIVELYVNDQNQWTKERPADLSGFVIIKAAKISVIAFEDILDYDLNGDEYYNCPHFYVRFNSQDSPFSEYYYQNLSKEAKGVLLYLDSSTMIKS